MRDAARGKHGMALMKHACIALATGCMLGLPLGSGASAQVTRPGGVSTTPDNQILVELAREDTTAANPFDLSGMTLVFIPDGRGGYSRSVQPLAWEEDLGKEISEGEEITLGFPFDFGGRTWNSFHVRSMARSLSEHRSPIGTTTRPTGSIPWPRSRPSS